jgi:hypothetical protein
MRAEGYLVSEPTMKNKPLKPLRGSVYAEFGLTTEEIHSCALCGVGEYQAMGWDGFGLTSYIVPPTPYCPVTGLVGVCQGCRRLVAKGAFEGAQYYLSSLVGFRRWQPPPMVQPVPQEPLYLLRRDFCDEERLARLIRSTWLRFPAAARDPLREHWQTREGLHSLFNGPLRVEALPGWTGRSNRVLGECWTQGHAIRLHSVSVQTMPDEALAALIAHEFAHAFQFATECDWGATKKAEEAAVEDCIRGWGFHPEALDSWFAQQQNEKWDREFERMKAAARKA